MAIKPPLSLRLFQYGLWTLLLAAIVYTVLPRFLTPATPVAETAVAIAAAQPTLGPGVAMNAPFKLLDENGSVITEADFAGRPSAWYYGFTACPDVCPAALTEFTAILEQLGPDADKLRMVFVTVDPERDPPEVLDPYLDFFDSRITGVTGELEAITQMARDRFVKFEKIPQGDTYAMQHPAGIFLVDATGQFAGTLDPEESIDIKVQKVRRLLGSADGKA
jgi:protein SCO1/2